jgi:intergrase/recombinase
VFITIVPEALIQEIAEKEKVTSPMVTRKLQRNGLRIRLNNLRDYYATFMVRNGLIKEEVDLLQGRIGKSIFVRHYWSPAIKELKQRVLKALKELEGNILS